VGGYCPGINSCPGGINQPSTHGFLDDNGVFTSLDYPGAQQTQALAIDNFGAIVGIYLINLTGPHAFLYQNGAYKNIDFPGAATWSGAVNNQGVVAGYYSGSTGLHGFRFQNGVFTTIDVPGASTTSVTGISDSGEIVGVDASRGSTENFKGISVGAMYASSTNR
jgi:uncharacterized membrane protein